MFDVNERKNNKKRSAVLFTMAYIRHVINQYQSCMLVLAWDYNLPWQHEVYKKSHFTLM